MKRLLLFALPIWLICGCVSQERVNVRNGLLITRERRSDFIKEWGIPTRTYSQSGHAEGFGVAWVGDKQKPGGNFALRSNRSYDLWYYAERKVTLVFDREILVAWAWGDEPQLLGPESK